MLIAYPTNNHVSAHNASYHTPLLWTFWTRFDSAASHLRKIRGWGPLAPPLQSVWHAHCDVIAAESRWWKTLSLLKQVISINIYTGAAGNDTSRRFSVCGDGNGRKSDVNEGVPHPPSSGMSTDPFIIIFVSIFTFCTKRISWMLL